MLLFYYTHKFDTKFNTVTKTSHEYIRVTYQYIRVTYEYIRVTYEYIRVTYDYIRVIYEYIRLQTTKYGNIQVMYEYIGRFPFDQKFRKFRVGERMEQTFSGISFRNFGCTSRGWPKIPENRNNRKIPFHSTIPARA